MIGGQSTSGRGIAILLTLLVVLAPVGGVSAATQSTDHTQQATDSVIERQKGKISEKTINNKKTKQQSTFNVDTEQPANVGSGKVELKANVTGLGPATDAVVAFKYWVKGKKNSPQWSGIKRINSPGTYTINTTRVQANTTYVVSARLFNKTVGWDTGSEVQFRTSQFAKVQGVDASQFPTVRTFVSVESQAARNGNLTAQNFQVQEEGVGQTITSVKATKNGTTTALDLVFVVDRSGSMSDEIATIRSEAAAISQNLSQSGRDTRFAVITFVDQDIRIDQTFTRDPNQVSQALQVSTTGALEYNYDALDLAMNQLNYRANAQKVIIDVTDEDADIRSSSPTQNQIANEIEQRGINYIAVSPDFNLAPNQVETVENESGAPQRVSNSTDKRVLAQKTNGQWYDINSVQFEDILQNITTRLSNQYIITYRTSLNRSEAPPNRTVTVTVTDPNKGTSTVTGSYQVPPRPLLIETKSVIDVEDTQVRMRGNVTRLGVSSSATAGFKYWVKGKKNSTTEFTGVKTVTSPGPYNITAFNLQPDTTYVVQAIGQNPNGEFDTGKTVQVTTRPLYEVTAQQPTTVGSRSATLEGNLTGTGGVAEVAVSFRYWVKGNKSQTTQFSAVKTKTSTGTFNIKIPNLQPNTTYVAEARAFNTTLGFTTSQTIQFTTQQPQFNVETDAPSQVGADRANFNGKVTGFYPVSSAEVTFRYWKEGQKASTLTFAAVETKSARTNYNISVAGLEKDTTYVVQAVMHNPKAGWDTGKQVRFTTKNRTYNVTTESATNVQTDSAMLEGDLTGLGAAADADVVFKYWVKGKKSSTAAFTAVERKTATGNYRIKAHSLQPNTTYVYRAVANNDKLGWVTGQTKEFTTGKQSLAVKTTSVLNVQTDRATLEGDLVSLGQASSAEVAFKYWVKGKKAPSKTTTTTSFSAVKTKSSPGTYRIDVGGLQEDTTYVFQAVTHTKAGGWETGKQIEFTTKLPPLNVETQSPTSVSNDTATLEGNLTALNGASTVRVSFKYWKKGNKSSTVAFSGVKEKSAPGEYSVTVSGLDPNSTYMVTAVANNQTVGWDTGKTVAFNTTASPAPSTSNSQSEVVLPESDEMVIHRDG